MRFVNICRAGFVFIIGLFLALACFSYQAGDASWNTVSDEIGNWMGAWGAVIADILWQGIGLMTPVMIAACLAWGVLILKGVRVRRRIGVFIVVLVLGCWLSARYEPLADTRFLKAGPGGFLGFYLGRWGVTSVVWIRILLWGIWSVAAIYAVAVPIRYGMKRIIGALPVLAKGLPLLKRAEKAVAPLTKIKVRKKEKPAVREKEAAAPKVRAVPAATTPYQLPSAEMLSPAKVTGNTISKETMATISRALEAVLRQFGIMGQIVGANPGPVVTLYEFEPASGVKTSRVIALSDDIAREMRAVSVRIAVVPGSNVIGIEMPNPKRDTVYIRELIESVKFKGNTGALPLILGKDIGGRPVYADLAKMPHLLVAGTTGSGKSVAINTMILSLLYRFTPAECRLILVDPKMVELSVYNNIPHLLTPVVTEAPKAVVALKWAVREMEDRYRAMSQLGVRNIDGYNQKLLQAAREGQVLTRRVQTGFDPETGKPVIEEQVLDLTPIPYIVMIVDEMSDLMGQCGKEAEPPILRLAQMARAVGIHLILATQRPSVDVITGLIKANFPTRISFQVTNKIDSRTILDEQGAEQLLGRGDMLYRPAGSKPLRIHGPFVSDEEVEHVAEHWRGQGEPHYLDAVITETEESGSAGFGGAGVGSGGGDVGEGGDLYDKAVAIVLRDKKVSTSYVQRQLRIGYNRAADLIDRMEAEGIISKPNVAGKRDILVPTDNA